MTGMKRSDWMKPLKWILLVVTLRSDGCRSCPTLEPVLQSLPLVASGFNLEKKVEEGNLQEVKDLVARGANVNHNNGAPLTMAARRGHVDIVKHLLESGANPDGDDLYFRGSVISEAARNNQLEVMDLLLEAGASVSHGMPGVAVLDKAAESGHVDAVRKLIEAGANPHGRGIQAMVLAAERGHVEVLRTFAEAGLDGNAGEGRVIRTAAREGQLEAVKALVDAGVTEEHLGDALEEAASKGHMQVVKFLLQNEANPNYDGVLSSAARHGSIDVVRTLLEAGSKITYEDDDGFPLHWAASKGHLEVMALLVEYGADVNSSLNMDVMWETTPPYAEYGEGWNVMHVIARFGYPLVKELLDLGVDINSQDSKGRTPLQVAVLSKKLVVAKQLLRYCADATVVNSKGRTALDLAHEITLKNTTVKEELQPLVEAVETIMKDRIPSAPSNEKSVKILSYEFLVRLRVSRALKNKLDDIPTKEKEVYESFYKIFEKRARERMVDMMAYVYCRRDLHKEELISIGNEYRATCECVPGEGSVMTLTPVIKPPSKCPSSTTLRDEVPTQQTNVTVAE